MTRPCIRAKIALIRIIVRPGRPVTPYAMRKQIRSVMGRADSSTDEAQQPAPD
jgi:hypothetical protein